MPDKSPCVVRELPWSPGGKPIPFLAGPGALTHLPRILAPLDPDRLILIADPAVQPLLPDLPCPATILLSPQRESHKTLAWLDQAACRALEDGATRRSIVLSFGGGLACNMAGMLAATLFRGLPLIHLPTTLLAMHDTVTSLKQAVSDLLEAITFDNKRGHLPPKADRVAMVLLRNIGQPARTGDVPLVQVPIALLSSVLRTLPFTA